MPNESQQAEAILDAALKLAGSRGWESLRLYDIAVELDIGLDDIYRHYAQKDDLVEAWFSRADVAMLAAARDSSMSEKTVPQRLQHLILTWLDVLAQHKQVTGDMLWYKLEPGHIHLQWAALLRISRTVQWLREGARQDSTHLLRIVEEIGLSSIFVAVFVYWLSDRSDGQQKTRAFLQRRLQQGGQCLQFWRSVLPAAAAGRKAQT